MLIFYQNVNFSPRFRFFLPKFKCFPKISIFDQNFDFRPKFWFSTKISIFRENIDFDQNFNSSPKFLWWKFRFLTKISIFDQSFNYWTKFPFFAQNIEFWPKFWFLKNFLTLTQILRKMLVFTASYFKLPIKYPSSLSNAFWHNRTFVSWTWTF